MLNKQARINEANTPLNTRLELWHPALTQTVDELGAEVDVDGKVADLFGNISMQRGTEVTENGVVIPYAYWRIRIHYRADISEDMYIKYGGKELKINSIVDLQERHHYMELQCTERRMPNG